MTAPFAGSHCSQVRVKPVILRHRPTAWLSHSATRMVSEARHFWTRVVVATPLQYRRIGGTRDGFPWVMVGTLTFWGSLVVEAIIVKIRDIIVIDSSKIIRVEALHDGL